MLPFEFHLMNNIDNCYVLPDTYTGITECTQRNIFHLTDQCKESIDKLFTIPNYSIINNYIKFDGPHYCPAHDRVHESNNAVINRSHDGSLFVICLASPNKRIDIVNSTPNETLSSPVESSPIHPSAIIQD